MKILITGSKGFIGKNLVQYLKANSNHTIHEFSKGDDLKELEKKINYSDFIIHLAGVNRPKNKELFKEVNINLTKYICKFLEKKSTKTPLLFVSSIQATLKNEYGISKFEAEKIVTKLSANNENPVFIYRLPGVFGKWCKPNYNSVVSTFCYNAINNLDLKIKEPSKELTLVYIDDVLKSFFNCLKVNKKGLYSFEIKPKYTIKLKDLAEKIVLFNKNREKLIIDNVGQGFNRKLYATFISFLNEERFDYPLKEHIDERGKFVEILKNIDMGQIAFFTAHPGITRGGHYHNTKTEKFVVIDGQAKFKFRNLANGKKIEIDADSNNPKVVDSIPGWVHNITNVGDKDLKVLLWSSEIFDKENPDTYQNEV